MNLEEFLKRYTDEVDTEDTFRSLFLSAQLMEDLKAIQGVDAIEELYQIMKVEFTAKASLELLTVDMLEYILERKRDNGTEDNQQNTQ